MKPILRWQYEQITKTLLLIQGHGSNDIGQLGELKNPQAAMYPEGTHELGSIQQCKPFFGGKHYRLHIQFFENCPDRFPLSLIIDLSLRNQWQAEVG